MSDLTRQQLCAQLAISESTVRRLELEGLPFTPAGRKKTYRLDEVKAWLRASSHFHPATVKPLPRYLDPQKCNEPDAWEDMPDALRKYLYGPSGVPPKIEPTTPAPPLTSHQRKKLRLEAERRKKEDRRALVTFHANKRRSAKLQRTPPWADLDAMRGIYEQASRLTRDTGIPHHVDHVIPLQGKLVSGLHVPGNLQILTGSENSKKRNHFEIKP